MQYIDYISAIGTGAIIVKLLDIFWLQRMIRNNEKDKWKRDQKIIIFSKVARDLVSQEEWGKYERSQKLYSLIGEASLLIENPILGDRLELFYIESLNSLRKSAGLRQSAENCGDEGLIKNAIEFNTSENRRLQVEAREILRLLKKDLLC